MMSSAGAPSATLKKDLPDVGATERLGAAIAGLLRRGDIVALYGDLGTGKTALTRALVRRLGYSGEVPSPTFTLVQSYEVLPVPVWHFDLYRIDDPEEILELGIEEAFAEAISVIEWPERMGALLPADRLDVVLSYAGRGERRRAILTGRGSWRARLAEAGDAL